MYGSIMLHGQQCITNQAELGMGVCPFRDGEYLAMLLFFCGSAILTFANFYWSSRF